MTAAEREDHESMPTGEQSRPRTTAQTNVGELDRWISSVGGGSLAALGAELGSWRGLALFATGGYFVYRGVSGYCPIFNVFGISTTPSVRPIAVTQTIVVDAEPADVYRFWRQLENLPRFMRHLESVTTHDERRSHWVAKAPAGTQVAWDAEIADEVENERIAWRSLPGADVDNRGEVRFETAPGGRGTLVRVELAYQPPAGRLGAIVAKLFGEEPSQQIADDLRRFKNLIETGEVPTNEGQPRGDRSAIGKILSPNS